MKKGAAITINFATIARFLRRFHIILFAVIAIGSLILYVFFINSIVITSTEAGDYTPQSNTVIFDQATMKRIDELKSSDQNSTLDLSSGRINPFVE